MLIEVDFTQSDFNDLLQDITLEEIEAATQTVVKAEGDIFNKSVNEEIERRWAKESEKIKEAYAEVEGYKEKTLKEVQSEIQSVYNQADQYADEQKKKKLTEVEQERLKKLEELQEKYNLVSSSENITPKRFAK